MLKECDIGSRGTRRVGGHHACFVQSTLENLVRTELIELCVPDRSIDEGGLGDETDDLAMMDGRSVAGGLPADRLHHTANRGPMEIGQVDGDLSARLDEKAECLHVPEAAGRLPDGSRDLPGNFDFSCGEIDIEGY